jgi:hypothetical protein
MKTINRCSTAMVSLWALVQAASAADFAAHEWGTFTSVQGAAGGLLSWRPQPTAELPDFVCNWSKPGRNRQPGFMLGGGKGGLTTLQRMETPVIYFYAKQETTVDVNVRFPKGFITEWYPQTSEIGPASYCLSMSVAPDTTMTQSGAAWKQVRIVPPGEECQRRNCCVGLGAHAAGVSGFACFAL